MPQEYEQGQGEKKKMRWRLLPTASTASAKTPRILRQLLTLSFLSACLCCCTRFFRSWSRSSRSTSKKKIFLRPPLFLSFPFLPFSFPLPPPLSSPPLCTALPVARPPAFPLFPPLLPSHTLSYVSISPLSLSLSLAPYLPTPPLALHPSPLRPADFPLFLPFRFASLVSLSSLSLLCLLVLFSL